MKRLLVLLVLVSVAAAWLVSCATPTFQAELSIPAGTENVELGNSTYIPIGLNGTLESNIEVVFAAVDKWEKAHPDKEIVDIDYVHQQRTYGASAYTFGIIIYSQSR